MNLMDLISEFHSKAERQGPGSDEMTKRALAAMPLLGRDARILDIGCGTGASTIVLARETGASFVALDALTPFLDELQARFLASGLQDRVQTVPGDMREMPFEPATFDAIWSEGAIYHIGFARGLREFRKYLKQRGCIAVSEIVWLTDERPKEIEDYWMQQYSGIDTIDNKLQAISSTGYELLTHFVLPEECWTEHYYKFNRARTLELTEKYRGNPEVEEFLHEGIREADLYDRYKDYYSYVFFVAQRTD